MTKFPSIRSIAALLGVMSMLGVQAQVGMCGARCYPEQMRSDLALLRSAIHTSHPDPYRYHTRSEIDRMVDSVNAHLNAPMAVEEFISTLVPVLHALGDAHTRVDLPQPCTDRLARSVPLIPIRVRVEAGEIYVEEEMKGFRSIPTGSRILSINGTKSNEIMARLFDHEMSDGADSSLRYHQIEQDFQWAYHTYVDKATVFDVRYETSEGVVATAREVGLTGEEMARTLKAGGVLLAPWRVTRYESASTTWLTITTLDMDELDRAGIKAAKYIDALLHDLRSDGTRTLVIDVRGASGKDLVMAEELFALVAQAPYRVVQGMSVRSTQVPDFYKFATPQEEFFASAGATYLPDRSGMYTLRPDDERLLPVKPRNDAFAGKVYVMQDGGTCDAAAAFAMMAHRSKRVQTVGEACGTNAASFCGGRELVITAPGTGVVFHVPLLRYEPDGAPAGPLERGEQPDHLVHPVPEALATGRDSVKDALLMLIREMQ